jgi:hypothetical protein
MRECGANRPPNTSTGDVVQRPSRARHTPRVNRPSGTPDARELVGNVGGGRLPAGRGGGGGLRSDAGLTSATPPSTDLMPDTALVEVSRPLYA